ncbi:MAG TPA: heparan-alpha-glucosaminide N-acetyltransferase domain-containing protein [Cytophagales bacterium]|jgi:uncharacterized membrane protein
MQQPPLNSLTRPAGPPTLRRGPFARVEAIDVVRGLVMAVMALDHVRDFWSPTPYRPEDLTQASALLFFTRWVTHFCAPAFVFLSGVSAFLYGQRQGSRRQLSRFLLTRGLWLVALEIVVINFLMQFAYNLLLLQVIWVIGWSMVALAALVWLPRWTLAGLAAVIVAGQHLLPVAEPVTAGNLVGSLLYHSPFFFPLAPLPPLLVAYTPLAWLGVMVAGYAAGPWFTLPAGSRNRVLLGTGLLLLVTFGVVRALNGYGDPAPWAVQPRGTLYTILSFLNVTKYPPSLLFLCLTLGVACLLLVAVDGLRNPVTRWLRTFGEVPFFYFLLHLLLIHAAARLWSLLAFGRSVNFSFTPQAEWPAGYHPDLGRAYLVWGLVLVALYFPCRWYGRYRKKHAHWWLSYL